MAADTLLLAALPAIAGFIALPAVIALCRRRATREASQVALALTEFALTVRRDLGRAKPHSPLDAELSARARRLRIPEFASLALAQELPHANPELLADTAQRLALRLKRRIAFERKMLARTASGRRRGAVAAAIPPVVLLLLHAFGFAVPQATLVIVICIEAFGCWLLWRLARVEI
jgi:Flp pilus assembly protein TadB